MVAVLLVVRVVLVVALVVGVLDIVVWVVAIAAGGATVIPICFSLESSPALREGDLSYERPPRLAFAPIADIASGRICGIGRYS